MTTERHQIVRSALIEELERQSRGMLYFDHVEGESTTIDGEVDIDALADAILSKLEGASDE